MNLNEAKKLIGEHVKDMIDICPHCGAKVHIVRLWEDHHFLNSGNVEFYVIFRCKPCKKLLLKTCTFFQDRYVNQIELKFAGWRRKFPVSLDTELSQIDLEYMPEDIFDDYEEALKCKSIDANRASCAMFRRALQSALVELGASKDSNLIGQIDSLDSLPKDIRRFRVSNQSRNVRSLAKVEMSGRWPK